MIAGLAAVSGGALAQEGGGADDAPRDITFRAFRKDNDIGTHAIRFRPGGALLHVEVAIDLKVTFGFLTLYRYTHRAAETWRDGRLTRLETTTNDNGDAFEVRAEAEGDSLRVDGQDGVVMLPAETLPTSYWRPDTPRRSLLLDTQRGIPLEVTAEPAGRERVPWRGGPAESRRYAVRGDLNLDLWYTADDELAKVAFAARGAEISYVPMV